MRQASGAFLGRYPQGYSVPASLVTVTASGTPTWPTGWPAVQVYGDSGLINVFSMPSADPSVSIGLFSLPIFIDQLLPRGRYRLVYSYRIGGYSGSLVDTFEVVGGGDPGGCVISMTTFDRPEARYVLGQLAAGRLVQGRNPRL